MRESVDFGAHAPGAHNVDETDYLDYDGVDGVGYYDLDQTSAGWKPQLSVQIGATVTQERTDTYTTKVGIAFDFLARRPRRW